MSRWTPEDLAAYQARRARWGGGRRGPSAEPEVGIGPAQGGVASERTTRSARRRRSLPATPRPANDLERAYAALLELRVRAGEVRWWAYGRVRLWLAPGCWYTPDFALVLASGAREYHETKGYMREAARVRLHVAASSYPERFVLVRRAQGAQGIGEGWSFEEVAP